jgi:hypothetical protein
MNLELSMDDSDRKRWRSPNRASVRLESIELEQLRGDEHEHDEPDADKHLEGPRAFDEKEQPVEEIVDERDVHRVVEPAVVRQGLSYFDEVGHTFTSNSKFQYPNPK